MTEIKTKRMLQFKSEDQMLAYAFQWAWNNYPQTRRLLFHVPNELDRLPGESKQSHLRRLSQAKAKGVVAGIQDFLFLWRGRLYAFEFKLPAGTVSDAQAEVHLVWNEHGTATYIIRSVEKFQEIFISII
jgi:hypothetical protein